SKISSRYEELDEKQRKIRVSTHEWNKEIDRIKSGGFVNESEFENIRKSMRGLSADSKTYEQDLKRIQTQIARMNTVSEKRSERKETRDIAKGRNDAKIESMRGAVPDSFLDEVKGLNNLLDFTSSKRDIAFIEDEMKKLVKLEGDIKKAGRDEEKIREVIADHQASAVKSVDKYNDIINSIVQDSNKKNAVDERQKRIAQDLLRLQKEIKKLEDNDKKTKQQEKALEQKRQTLSRLSQEQRENQGMQNKIEEDAARLQREINQLKERGLQLSYDEQREIQQKISALKQLSQIQRNSNSSGSNRDIQEQKIRDKFNSTSYRATRGFSENSAEARKIKGIIEDVEAKVNGLSGKVGDEFHQATREIEESMNHLNSESRRLRDEDQRRRGSMGGQLVNALRKVPVWTAAMGVVYGTIQQVKNGFRSILDIDKEMVNLAKVSEASKQQLDAFKNTASAMGRDLGVVATEVIKATTEFQRLGYSLEQATVLGKNSILYANVGDMSVEDASSNLVSTIKGFGVEVDAQGNNVRKLVDMFNEVGNNFAISSEGIGEALKRSSAVFNEAGTSIQDAVGLVTAANSVVQDPDKVGNGLKTIAMRLRGVKEEGDGVEELVPQLQKTFDRINKDFGLMNDEILSVMEEDGVTFKSTYKIFEGVAKVWDKLTDLERANLVETMGGKHQGVVVSAIIQNWEDAQKASETASNSAGSASREFSAYMDGFEYKIGQLKNAIEHFWTTIVDDDAVKWFIDVLTSIVDGITSIVDTFGATNIIVLMSGLVAVMASKPLRDSVTTVGALGRAFEGLGGFVMKFVSFLPRLIPYVAVLLAIGTAATVVVKAFTAESRARKERLKVLDAEISKLKDYKQSYEETFNQKDFKLDDFADLQAKGTNRTSQEEEKYLGIVQKIKTEMPELISYYN
ncbi:phage tail tape measure protein, partial [Paenibacillus alvei]